VKLKGSLSPLPSAVCL